VTRLRDEDGYWKGQKLRTREITKLYLLCFVIGLVIIFLIKFNFRHL
jgi:hypothetical protein